MPIRLVIAAEVEPALVAALEGDPRFEVLHRHDEPLEEAVRDAEILVTRTTNKVTTSVIASAPRLRLIAQGTAGIDNIDEAGAAARGIDVIQLPGINANAVAELVIGHIIALTRTVPLYVSQMRSRQWQRGDCTSRHELRHHTLGVIGFGNVGSRVARLASAFGMPVVAYDPYVPSCPGATRVESLPELLACSEIVTLHVPLTSETRRMIGQDEIASMRRGSILINAARGEVLDLEAALHGLRDQRLGGLALDVYDEEPPSIDWPDNPRLIVTPHIAGCTSEAKGAAASLLYDRIVKWVTTRGER